MMGFPTWDWEESKGMQSDLTYMPAAKRRELGEIVDIIRAHREAEMIILYGSYARGEWKEAKDLKPGRWSGHVSDYDLLVVTETAEQAKDVSFWNRVEAACNARGFSARVQLIVHDIAAVNADLEEGRYFFRDIAKEGRLLYESGRFQLAEPAELAPDALRRLAQEYFDVWFEAAERFYKASEWHLADDDLRRAIFNLNQAAESAYKCILLVFTSYCPHEHLLQALGPEAAEYGPVYLDIFPQDTDRAEERFKLLDKAYIGARYHKSFPVFPQDLDYLAPRVKRLLEVTEAICRERIEAIGQGLA